MILPTLETLQSADLKYTLLEQRLFRFLPIDSSSHPAWTVLNYLLDYAILFLIMVLTMCLETCCHEEIIAISLGCVGVKLLSCAVYILVQAPWIRSIQKIACLVSLVYPYHSFPVGCFVLLLELMASLVWTSTIEQRLVRIDSRLQLSYPFAKQIIIYVILLLSDLIIADWSEPVNSIDRLELLCMLVMIVGCLGWIDQHDMLYWSKMKEGFIAMDYLLLATVLCLFVLPKERISVYSVLLCDLMMLIVIFYYLLNKMDDHSLITKINIKKLRKLPDNQVIQYFLQLYSLTQPQNSNNEYRNNRCYFLEKFNQQNWQSNRSNTPKMLDEISQHINQHAGTVFMNVNSDEYQCAQIRRFLGKELTILSKRNQRIRKFLFFLLSPHETMYTVMDMSKWEDRREYQRISVQLKDKQGSVKVFQQSREMRTINTMIQQYLRRSRRFYMHLLSDYLSSNFLLSAGKYTLDIGDKIEDKKKHPHLYAEDIRVLLNSFSTQLCINPGIILDKTDNLPYLLQRTQQTNPFVLISAEQSTLGHITAVNSAFIKITYFSRAQLQSLGISGIIPELFRAEHSKKLPRRATRLQFSGCMTLNNELYFPNALGYKVLCTVQIYPITLVTGRNWCYLAKQKFEIQAILIITDGYKLEGMTELCRYYGITPLFNNFTLCQSVIDSIFQDKHIILPPQSIIFQNSSFMFTQEMHLSLLKSITYFQTTYHLVEIVDGIHWHNNQLKQIEKRRKKKGMYNINMEDSNLSKTMTKNSSFFKLHSQPSSRDPLAFEIAEDPIREQDSIDTRELVTNQFSFLRVETSHFPHELARPSHFQFYYHWSGFIKNYPEKHPKYPTTFANNAETVKFECEDIAQMRLIGDRIDFVSNIDKETDFQSYPLGQTSMPQPVNCSRVIYQRIVLKRKSESASWLIKVRVILAIAATISLICTGILYSKTQSSIAESYKQLQVMCLLNSNHMNYLDIAVWATLPLFPNHPLYPSAFKEILAKLSSSQNYSNIIESLYQSYTSSTANKNCQNMIAKLQILLSNFFNNTEFSSQQTILNLIVPNISNCLSQANSQYFSSIEPKQGNILFLVVCVHASLSLALLIWLFRLFGEAHQEQCNWLKILKDVCTESILKELANIDIFQADVYYGKQLKCGHENPTPTTEIFDSTPQLNAEAKRDHLLRHRKKITLPSKLQSSVFCFFVWIVAMSLLQSLQIDNTSLQLNIQRNYLNYTMLIGEDFGDRMKLWVQFNSIPVSEQNLLTVLKNGYEVYQKREVVIWQLMRNGFFSENFISFYSELWNGNCCELIAMPNCTVEYPFMAEGINLLLAYFDRNYDSMMVSLTQQPEFTPQSTNHTAVSTEIIDLLLNVMSNTETVIYTNLQKQYAMTAEGRENTNKILYVLQLGVVLCLIAIERLSSLQESRVARSAQLLLLIPFDQLQAIDDFKIQYKRCCDLYDL